MTERERVVVRGERDIVSARQRGRALAKTLGFDSTDQTLLATAISELARNILSYAGEGEIELGTVENGGQPGIEIIARDKGPGITNIEAALRDGYSTGGGLGLGLPGTRRLVDEFELQSEQDQGTTVTLRRWLP